MTNEEIKQADKFVEEHVMYEFEGTYYAVNTINKYGDDLDSFCGESDFGAVVYFPCVEIETEFPHIANA